MDFYNIAFIQLIAEIIIFMIPIVIFEFASKKIDTEGKSILNLESIFPKEEIHSLRQIFYLD